MELLFRCSINSIGMGEVLSSGNMLLFPNSSIDEIDSLQNQTLISVLRQLRDGFPHSLGLIGMRDVRDYKVKSSGSERKSDPLTKGLTQLDKYLDGLGLHTGWLVIFDRRPGLPPMGERISTEEVISPSGRTITVIRS